MHFHGNQTANNIFQLQERVSARDGGGWTGNQYSLPGRQNTMKKPGRQNIIKKTWQENHNIKENLASKIS